MVCLTLTVPLFALLQLCAFLLIAHVCKKEGDLRC